VHKHQDEVIGLQYDRVDRFRKKRARVFYQFSANKDGCLRARLDGGGGGGEINESSKAD